MKRSAFTMIELVTVIVLMGILAALAIPRMGDDVEQEAKDNIFSALRYTQHLALVDNKTDPRDPSWQQELWTMRFSLDGNGRYFYTISSNSNHGANVDKEETAIDLANGKYMYNLAGNSVIDADESPNIFIGKKYGIDSVVFGGGCRQRIQHIAFDHLGRPFKSGIYGTNDPYGGYMTSDCTLTIGFENSDIDDIVYTIKKETGEISVS